MSERLPVFIDPIRLAQARRRLVGTLPLKEMDRLSPYIVNDNGQVAVELEFGVDDQKVRYLRGHIKADLEMCCQRCMGSVVVPIEKDVSLGLVGSEAEAERLEGVYEPLLVTSREVRLSEIVEDELLLAIPMIAMHPEGECASEYQEKTPPEEETAEPRKSPFDVLAELKKRK